MTLKDLQTQVDEWISQFKSGYWAPLSINAQISEEAGELSRELNDRYGGRVKKSSEDTKDIGKEICDVMFALICLANSHKINLDESWNKMMQERLYERDKNRYEKKE